MPPYLKVQTTYSTSWKKVGKSPSGLTEAEVLHRAHLVAAAVLRIAVAAVASLAEAVVAASVNQRHGYEKTCVSISPSP